MQLCIWKLNPNMSFGDRHCISVENKNFVLLFTCCVSDPSRCKHSGFTWQLFGTCTPSICNSMKTNWTSKETYCLPSSSKLSLGDGEVEVRALTLQSGSAWRFLTRDLRLSRSQENLEVSKGPACVWEMEKECLTCPTGHIHNIQRELLLINQLICPLAVILTKYVQRPASQMCVWIYLLLVSVLNYCKLKKMFGFGSVYWNIWS